MRQHPSHWLLQKSITQTPWSLSKIQGSVLEPHGPVLGAHEFTECETAYETMFTRFAEETGLMVSGLWINPSGVGGGVVKLELA